MQKSIEEKDVQISQLSKEVTKGCEEISQLTLKVDMFNKYFVHKEILEFLNAGFTKYLLNPAGTITDQEYKEWYKKISEMMEEFVLHNGKSFLFYKVSLQGFIQWIECYSVKMEQFLNNFVDDGKGCLVRQLREYQTVKIERSIYKDANFLVTRNNKNEVTIYINICHKISAHILMIHPTRRINNFIKFKSRGVRFTDCRQNPFIFCISDPQ